MQLQVKHGWLFVVYRQDEEPTTASCPLLLHGMYVQQFDTQPNPQGDTVSIDYWYIIGGMLWTWILPYLHHCGFGDKKLPLAEIVCTSNFNVFQLRFFQPCFFQMCMSYTYKHHIGYTKGTMWSQFPSTSRVASFRCRGMAHFSRSPFGQPQCEKIPLLLGGFSRVLRKNNELGMNWGYLTYHVW